MRDFGFRSTSKNNNNNNIDNNINDNNKRLPELQAYAGLFATIFRCQREGHASNSQAGRSL
jgi:hypothetical protein